MTQREKLIFQRLQEHYDESLQYFPEEQIVGVFLQGSQNYGLDYEGSDVDTKLIVVPSFKDVCLNKKPVSTTHVRANDEHTDWKDVRLYRSYRCSLPLQPWLHSSLRYRNGKSYEQQPFRVRIPLP